MEDIHSSYLSGQDDVDNLPYSLPSLGQNEACAPMPCPGGVEIVLVGGGEPTVGAYPGETGILPSYSHIGYREESRDGLRLTHSREPDGLNCGIMGRPEQDHLSSKYALPPPDPSTLHHFAAHQPGTHTTSWSYSDTNEDLESDEMHQEEKYLQHRRFEWTSGLEDGEGNSQLMMVRSDPPSITMPAFRRALQLGKVHEAWQGGNYSEEDAHVEVEEEEEEEEGSVYTCIECSIYFKKKAHLLEHMFQHSQEGEEGKHGVEGNCTCGECGKGFGDEESLESHRQLHQESRKKIIEEISKLESFADEGRDARLQCPKCLFGTNSSKVFVQHAKTHVKKVGGDTRTTSSSSSSFKVSSEMAHGGETLEPPTEGISKPQEIENTAEPARKVDKSQAVIKGPNKMKGKATAREESHSLQNNHQRVDKEGNKPRRTVRLPEAAVHLKRRFREALRAAGEREGDQRRLREEVAVVLLENIGSKKKRTKANQPCGYRKRLPISKTLFSRGSLAHHLPREDWADDGGEDDIPLDTLLTDPKYASQLEALGLRSEERECPYCPDRFHNGIGLANHVRGHLNRVGVSYNVRHFISAEEVKAIEQNYSFQKKRKKVANFDPSTFSLMRCEFCGAGFDTRAGLSSHARAHLRDFGITNWELTVSPIHVLARLLARSPGRPLPPIPPWHQDADTDVLASDEDDGPLMELVRGHSSQPDRSSVEKMILDRSTSKADDPKASQSDPSRDIRCEFCNEFFENRKGLSSHARSHLRQMGITEWHVNGSPIDTLREIVRKRHPATSQQQVSNIKKEPCGEEEPPSPSHRLSPPGVTASVMARDVPGSPPGRSYNSFLSPAPTKRPMPNEPRLTQFEPKGYMNAEPKTCSPPKSYIQGQSRPKSYITEDGRPKTFIHSDGKPNHFLQSGEGHPKTFVQEGRPKGFLPNENRPKTFVHGDGKPKTYLQGEAKPKSFMPGENRPKPFLPGESKPKSLSPDDKLKAYIQSELPFKVKMKASPEKAITSMEAACELCGLIFENRKALASHARAHLRQFGVTEWCVNGSPIETLREWMKQRPQKAGAYLSYIQGRPFSKKFKRALQSPKPGPEKESPTAIPGKMAEKEHIILIPCSPAEKPAELQAQKFERRHPKAPEVPPAREYIFSEPLPKNEEPRPPVRPRPVPSLVPRPPQTSLVKFVGNIYTLKCRFCDIQFQGPLSIQKQWVRHLQHHILQMKFSKTPSPPLDVSSQEQPEAVTSQ